MTHRCMIFTMLIWFLVQPAQAAAEMTSPGFQITTTVMSGSGGKMNSPGYSMQTTLGQPTPIPYQDNTPESESFRLYPGFIYTLLQSCFGDFDVDGDVDGKDLLIIMTGYSGSFDTIDLTQFASEFGKNNCL